MKRCIKCKLYLNLSSFHKSGKYLKSVCKDCCKLQYLNNKEHLNNYQKERYKEKQEDLILYQRKWRSLNKHIKSETSARERFKKKQATPKWLTRLQIKEMQLLYLETIRISAETGIKHHVDHIVPLNSKLVCGLHVPWNLQILTETENLKKSNIFVIT